MRDLKPYIRKCIIEFKLANDDPIRGVILRLTEEFILLSGFDESYVRTGFTVIPVSQITDVEIPDTKSMRWRFVQAKPEDFNDAIALDSWRDIMIQIFAMRIPVNLSCRFGRESFLVIGTMSIADIEETGVRLREIDCDGIWEKEPTFIPYDAINTVTFGDHYSVGLADIARKRLPKPPQHPYPETLVEALEAYGANAVFEFKIRNHAPICGVVVGRSARFLLLRELHDGIVPDHGFLLLRTAAITKYRCHADPSSALYRIYRKRFYRALRKDAATTLPAKTSLTQCLASYHNRMVMLMLKDGSLHCGYVVSAENRDVTLREFDADGVFEKSDTVFAFRDIIGVLAETDYLSVFEDFFNSERK